MKRVLSLLVVLLVGCASHCPEVNALRDALANRPSTSDPHVVVNIPFSVAQPLVTEELAKVKPLSIAPPKLDAIPLLRLLARPSAAKLVVLGEGRLGLDVRITIDHLTKTWLEVHATVRLTPRIADRAVVFQVRPEDLAQVEPRFGKDARAAIVNALPDVFPLSDELGVTLADELIAYIGGEGFTLLRDELLTPLGAFVELPIALPAVPVAAIDVRASSEPFEQIAIQVQMDRPVEDGVDTSFPPERSDAITVRMSGSAMAQLANWGMDEGHLPARYNDDMKADPDGELRPRLAWKTRDDRPLRMHVFMDEPECVRILIAAKMSLGVVDGKLHSKVRDGEIVDVEGSWRAQIGVWLDQLGKGPIAFVQERAATLSLDGREATVSEAELDGDELVMALML